MVTRDPDVTRLVDRLERRDLVQRDRIAKDRRVVNVRITQKGVKMLVDLEPITADLDRNLMVRLDEGRLKLLIDLLEDARGGPK
jgi:DNA-binding MarR family transcriptional regulator